MTLPLLRPSPRPGCHSAVAWLGSLLLLGSVLPAQYKRMASQLNECRNISNALVNLVKENKDDRKILETNQQLRQACASAADGLRGFGARLARAANTDVLKEPDKYGNQLVVDLTEYVGKSCDRIKALVESSPPRSSDYQQNLERVAVELFVKTAGNCQPLQRARGQDRSGHEAHERAAEVLDHDA